ERARRAAALPDPAEVVRRVALPSVTLWERRYDHHDFLKLRAGVGDVPWHPPVAEASRQGDVPDDLAAVLADAGTLSRSPVELDLAGGGVVGIVGDRPAALALARSLVCQAAVHHGPADLPMMVLARPEAAAEWDWVKWLPHTRDATGAGRVLSADPELSARMVEARLRAAETRDRPGPRRPGGESPVGP